MSRVRLQKVLQSTGIASRRGAESMIQDGCVRVNGAIVTQMGLMVDPEKDAIKVGGKRVMMSAAKHKVYLAFYKPKGILCSHDDPQERKTLWELLPNIVKHKGLTYGGRLDLQSEGLVLLSNDGEFIQHCSHPRYKTEKVYWAKVRGVPTDKQLAKLSRGIFLDGHRTLPCRVKPLPRSETKHTWCEITLLEGRKQQIRKMFYAIGHGVIKLKRVRIGPVHLGHLQPGQTRNLFPEEVARILHHE